MELVNLKLGTDIKLGLIYVDDVMDTYLLSITV